MKKLLPIVALFVAITTATAQPSTPAQNFIEVRGVAKTMIEPNRAEISITLNQADSKGKLSIGELESQLAKALQEAGVDAAKQLVLQSQSSEAQKRNKAYQFKSYILTVSSAEDAQNIFDAFAVNGINNASVTKVWNDSQNEIIEKLKVEAMLDAQRTAKTLTAAIGQTIGGAIQITDYLYNNDVIAFARKSDRSMSMANEAVSLPTLDFNKIKIERSVTVKFALEK